jgi:hypothetical protein
MLSLKEASDEYVYFKEVHPASHVKLKLTRNLALSLNTLHALV